MKAKTNRKAGDHSIMQTNGTDCEGTRTVGISVRLVIVALTIAKGALAAPPRELGQRVTAAQARALSALPADVDVVLDDQDVPSFVHGRLSARSSRDPATAARRALETHGDAFRRRLEDGFAFRLRDNDELGMTHVRMAQTYKGIPVVGGELIVHLSADAVEGINGRFAADVDIPSVEPSVTDQLAAQRALDEVQRRGGSSAQVLEVGRPVVLADGTVPEPRLAIPVKVAYAQDAALQLEDIFVDARDANVLGRHAEAYTAKFRKIYDGQQGCSETQLKARFLFQEGSTSSDVDAVAAYNGTGITYDFYKAVFNRDSYDNLGSALVSTQHFTFGSNCTSNNAQWLGAPYNQMAYGDGDGDWFSNLAGDLDITAHELTHGVTYATAKLVYANESGALNEATSDILGESAAFWAGKGDWMLGAAVYTPYVSGDALRYMFDPTQDGYSTDFYPDRLYSGCTTPDPDVNDFCGVHGNSGIANLFYYLLAQGGQHPRQRTTVNVPGIGIGKAQQIWYRALTRYMTSTTNFAAARTYTAQAAADLYGGVCSTTWQSVQKAWDAVGVPGTWSCSGSTASQKLLNPGFESGNVSWAASAGVIVNSTARPAHTGSWKAWLNGYGSTSTQAVYQDVAIPSSVTSATLSFWLRIDTAETSTTTAYDRLQVQIRDTANGLLATLATYSNLNKNTTYTQKAFNLTSYKGRTIRVYFLGMEDASYQTSFVIDDTALTVQ